MAGFDFNALSEVLGCLPHDPPLSILQASPLTALLTVSSHLFSLLSSLIRRCGQDAATKHCTSYLSVLAVNRKSPPRPNTPSKYADTCKSLENRPKHIKSASLGESDYGASVDYDLAAAAVQALRIASLPK